MTLGVFGFAEVDSWLRRRNPAAKLAAHLALTILLTLVFDPLTPLAFFGVALVAGRLLGRIHVSRLVTALPAIWLPGIALVVSNALFADNRAGATVVWDWGPFAATAEGAMIGLCLAERMVAIATFSVIFTMSTDPTDLVRSLVQQLHMAPRFAYTVLAAYRFLPELQREYESIGLARRMRSGRRPSGAAAWLAEQRAVLMPFIAGAIRRTDRVAVAMDSRGFAGRRPRTHYRTLRIGGGDIAMLLGTLAVALGIVTLSALAGSLRLWTGVLAG